MTTYHLHVDELSKQFGQLKANDRVSIKVRRGTIHAILGENGAGKSTLMSMLYGLQQPDSGTIRLNGEEVRIDSPRKALSLGIGMVHQHFMLIDPLTVTENIILGLSGAWYQSLERHAQKISALSKQFGFEVAPDQIIASLPIGMQQRVEILKSLYRDVDLLILDEPTSVLTPVETASFFKMLCRLREAGKTVILITHKLEEVMALSDRVTVMRQGLVTDELNTVDTSAKELARLMVGRDVVFKVDQHLKTTHPDNGAVPLLLVTNVSARSDRGTRALENLSFSVQRGEILGFAGVDGNGQAELAEVLAGLRAYSSGSIMLDDNELGSYTVAQRLHDLGVGFVPEDRHRTGLVLDYSVANNLILRSFNKPPFIRSLGILDRYAINANAERLVENYHIRSSGVRQPVRRLSGGNQQKVILAREIEAKPRLLIVAQPCKGLDVGAIEFVQSTLIAQRNAGVGIIYISTELEHILAVCDRVAVLYQGRITGYVNPAQTTSEEIGQLMAGVQERDRNAA